MQIAKVLWLASAAATAAGRAVAQRHARRCSALRLLQMRENVCTAATEAAAAAAGL